MYIFDGAYFKKFAVTIYVMRHVERGQFAAINKPSNQALK
jgi:hypothetical protein